MITAGIDMGAKTVKVLILKDGEVLAKEIAVGGLEEKRIAKELFESALKAAKLTEGDLMLGSSHEGNRFKLLLFFHHLKGHRKGLEPH